MVVIETVVEDVMTEKEAKDEVVTDVPAQEVIDEVLDQIQGTEVKEGARIATQNQDAQVIQIQSQQELALTDQDVQDANIQTSLLLSKRFVNFKTKILHRHKTWYFVYYFYAQL